MALSFPLSLAAFFGDLAQVTCQFTLTEAVEHSETGSGETLVVDYGPRLWEVAVTLAPAVWADALTVQAKLNALTDARASFLATPTHAERASAPAATINAVQNGREIRLNMTTGQSVTAGQFLSFSYGSSPTRYALHQILENATAASGVTPYFEVTPAIRAGYATSAPVDLGQPVAKFKMIPGTLAPMTARAIVADGLAFRGRQTLR